MLACLLAVTPVLPLGAQSTPKPAAATPASASIPPSRHVNAENLPEYLRSVSSAFSIRSRETDPFGRFQDPNSKPIIKPTLTATKRVVPQATPFPDIVNLIKVTTIMPGERRFLIGNRTVSQGDTVPLAFRGKNLRVVVVSVSSNRISFRNVDNGETAELALNMMPAGMRPGNDGIHAPGMVPDNPNAPIDLDGNSLPLDAAQYSR